MTGPEFSNQFSVLYNNITSNQAPGLSEYEKSVFLTKAQDELIKNYFLPQSNPKQAGFDGNQKRQMDFSLLMRTKGAEQKQDFADNVYSSSGTNDYDPSYAPGGETVARAFDPRGGLYIMPSDLFIPINETLHFVIKKASTTAPGTYTYTTKFQRQVIPMSYDEYTRQMNKPYKEPVKGQAWRLLVNNSINVAGETDSGKLAEIIIGHNDLKWKQGVTENEEGRYVQYIIRYIKRPQPVIIAPIDSYDTSINGHDGHYTDENDYDDAYTYNEEHTEILDPCELDESLHEEILQRAVELAKVAWTATGQENVQLVMQAGQRSE